MNRKQKRASEKMGRISQRKEWDGFIDITFEAIKTDQYFGPGTIVKPNYIYKNNKYVVFIFHNQNRRGRAYTKVMVRRCDAKPMYKWHDLFRIKNEIFGEEIEAVQFLPKKSELTDVANLYWFWIETKDANA